MGLFGGETSHPDHRWWFLCHSLRSAHDTQFTALISRPHYPHPSPTAPLSPPRPGHSLDAASERVIVRGAAVELPLAVICRVGRRGQLGQRGGERGGTVAVHVHQHEAGVVAAYLASLVTECALHVLPGSRGDMVAIRARGGGEQMDRDTETERTLHMLPGTVGENMVTIRARDSCEEQIYRDTLPAGPLNRSSELLHD